jgi:hypothetical protein
MKLASLQPLTRGFVHGLTERADESPEEEDLEEGHGRGANEYHEAGVHRGGGVKLDELGAPIAYRDEEEAELGATEVTRRRVEHPAPKMSLPPRARMSLPMLKLVKRKNSKRFWVSARAKLTKPVRSSRWARRDRTRQTPKRVKRAPPPHPKRLQPPGRNP